MGKNTAVVDTEDDDQLAFLLPGHIWRRTETDAKVTVIAVTNTYLPPKAKKKYPPQVVYADELNRITSVPVDRFLDGRVFENVNPDVEKRVEQLFTPFEAEASISSDAPISQLPYAVAVESPVEISFESSSNQQMPELPAGQLVEAFQQYEQDPDLINGFIRHKLLFSMRELTLADFRAAFGNPGAVYGTIHIKSDNVDTNIEWDEFHGAYPVVSHEGTSAVLVFLTAASTVAADTAAPVATETMVSETAPVEPTVQTSTVVVAPQA
jgi:hypothetical protein